jgi:hypothetical protein
MPRRIRTEKLVIAAARIVLVLAGISVTVNADEAPRLSAGQVLESVVCASDSSQTYALYIPSNYSAARHWPIIYFFDPGGRGSFPIQLYKEIAEKYGFIIAGSNNSHNFSTEDLTNTLNAFWQDTHRRLILDDRRTYTSGFSGGSRVASIMALGCGQCHITGVIAHGAGYAGNERSEAKDKMLYFLVVGDVEFNWREIVGIRRERETLGQPYRERTFPGPHQWAPTDVMEEAIQWMNLKSMQAGSLSVNQPFIEQYFQQLQSEAEDAVKKNDPISQLSANRCLVSDFAGLKDVRVYEKRLADLKSSAQLKAALKAEHEQIEEQEFVEAEIGNRLYALTSGNSDATAGLRSQIIVSMQELKNQSTHAKTEARRRLATRAFSGAWAEGIEAGQQQLVEKHFEQAEAYFQIMASVADRPGPMILLAETHAAQGNRKQAMKDLREAIRRGLNSADAIEKDSNLQFLRGDPDFQKLITELRAGAK